MIVIIGIFVFLGRVSVRVVIGACVEVGELIGL